MKSNKHLIFIVIFSILVLLITTVVLFFNFRDDKNYNRLVNEQSPYLQLHANHSIWWFPWGDKAFEKAKKNNQLIYLSIGYSSCHWCHVMEGDSFQDPEIASFLNKNFISIKVDREERPDIDRIYMDILVAMNGNGGWPVNMILLPDGTPVIGATFMPKKNFLSLLKQVHSNWLENPDTLNQNALSVQEWIKDEEKTGFSNTTLPDDKVFQKYLADSEASFDPEFGGFGFQVKFPKPFQLSMLLRIYKRTNDVTALNMVTTTLDNMYRGGLFDQLGGGFYRYSTDRKWHIPHFEKMLYTNALIVLAYLEAYQVTHKKEYAQVARETLDYVLQDLAHPGGGFYSAEDADSEKTEGKFYVWSENELKEVLTREEFNAVQHYYHVTAQGNFNPIEKIRKLEEAAGLMSIHNVNVFFLTKDTERPDGSNKYLKMAREKLKQIRSKRVRPLLDNKILTSWNALIITALAKASTILNEKRYLVAATKTATFILKEMRNSKGELFRRWLNGSVKHRANLDDYAYFIQSLISLYESDFSKKWIDGAIELQSLQDELFLDNKHKVYYYTDGSDAKLIQRKIVLSDDASLPSANAISALNLMQLADFTLKFDYKKSAAKIISSHSKQMITSSISYSQMLIALDYLTDLAKEIVIIGEPENKSTLEMIQFARSQFIPNKILAFGLPEMDKSRVNDTLPILFGKELIDKKTTAYVCENNVCNYPTTDFLKYQEIITKPVPYHFD